MVSFKKIIGCAVASTVTLISTIPIFAAALHAYDVNGDGNVTVADYSLINSVLRGYKPLSYDRFDVNNNDVISMVDGELVLDYAWNNTSNASVSVQNFGDLLVGNENDINSSTGVTYKKYNCATGAVSEYTLTLTEQTASTASVNSGTPMAVDYNETAVVKLVEVDDSDSWGTGTIIGNHIIATAAHCVYDFDTSSFTDNTIKIVNSGNNVIATYTPSYIHVPKEYTITEDNIYDYALIYVNEDLSQYGKFEVGIPLDSFILNTNGNYSIKVSGFPTYSEIWTPIGAQNGYRYVSEGDVKYKNYELLRYEAITNHGDSGGPAYIDETFTLGNEQYSCKTMVGIHIGSNHDESGIWNTEYGWANRIKSEHMKFFFSNPNLN